MTWRAWTQYAPKTGRTDIGPSLAARLRDPLWLLARQRQIGEFFGEDAGSPVRVEVETEAFVADRCRIGAEELPFDPATTPLEALVEREPRDAVPPDLRARAHWGQFFVQRLRDEGVEVDPRRLAERFGFPPADRAAADALDAAARAIVRAAPDAENIRAHFGAAPTTDTEILDAFPTAPIGRLEPFRRAIDRWLGEYAAVHGTQPGDAWLTDRFEYAFEVSVPTDVGRVVLRAPEHHGGRLDWDAFDVAAVQSGSGAPGERSRQTVLATQVGYLGMPAARFWEFEDAGVDFGDPGGGERDIGRLLLAEIALAWGNDWFQVPIDAPSGALVRVNELLVTDTFGITTRIPAQHRHSPTWAMNRLTRGTGVAAADDFLWLAPALPAAHDAPPLEQVLLRRDEMANLAWAIELVVADGFGRPVSLQDAPDTRLRGLARLRPHADLLYRLVPDLPETWAPMVPTRGTDGARLLVLAGLLDEDGLDPPEPQGVLLTAATPLRLHEEELTRAGFAVSRHWQLARWHDGRRCTWIGRLRLPGAGELRSELEFDSLTTAQDGDRSRSL